MRRIGMLAAIIAIGTAGSASAATIQVDSATDEGTGCTLREAIASADGNADSGGCTGAGYGDDTITFAPSVTGTIPLGSELAINPTAAGTLSIQGPGAGSLALSGQDASRVIRVSAAANSAANAVHISGLEIRDGFLGALDVNSEAHGAGVLNAGQLTLDQVSLKENAITVNVTEANPFVATGGAGVASQASLLLVRSTVSDNTVSATGTTDAGGIAFVVAEGAGVRSGSGSTLTVRQSTISGNSTTANATGASAGFSSATASGGGVAAVANFTPVSGSIEGSTVVGNAVNAIEFGGPIDGQGGGVGMFIQNTTGSLSVNRSTIAANSGNTVFSSANLRSSGGTLTVQGTVIAEPQGPGTSCGPSISSAGHNLSDDMSCGLTGTGDVQGTPAGLQASLTDNGGPTLTRRPLPGSPLIDTGIAAGQTIDQRGLPRTVEYDVANGAGDGTDKGAVEIQGATPTATTPASPNDDPSPEVMGAAEPGSTVHLFSDTGCATEVGSGTAVAFANPGFTVGPFALDSTTSFRANAVYGTATSACSPTGVTYQVPPAAPSLTSVTPLSGSNDNDPRITGASSLGTTVNLYTAADCSGPVAGTGTDGDLSGLGIQVHVADNTTTTFYGQASSANGTSPGSAGITYTEVTPPPDPGNPGTNPGTPPPAAAPVTCKKGQKLKGGRCVKKKKKKRRG